MKRFFRFFYRKQQPDFITIVSGLPRSGTSMMMKMLEAGGLEPLTDNIRKADDDNPKGYYEFERVKKMPEGDIAWLADASGKSVKIISALLPHLPVTYQYKIIFMSRQVNEILASQKKMLIRRNEPTDRVGEHELAELYRKHLVQTFIWLDKHKNNISCLKVNYNALLKNPSCYIAEITNFLDRDLNVAAMTRIIDPTLYRQREEEK